MWSKLYTNHFSHYDTLWVYKSVQFLNKTLLQAPHSYIQNFSPYVKSTISLTPDSKGRKANDLYILF